MCQGQSRQPGLRGWWGTWGQRCGAQGQARSPGHREGRWDQGCRGLPEAGGLGRYASGARGVGGGGPHHHRAATVVLETIRVALGSQPYTLLRLQGPDMGQKSEPGSPSHLPPSSHLPLPQPHSPLCPRPRYKHPCSTPPPPHPPTATHHGTSADADSGFPGEPSRRTVALLAPPKCPPALGRAVLLGSRGPPTHTWLLGSERWECSLRMEFSLVRVSSSSLGKTPLVTS